MGVEPSDPIGGILGLWCYNVGVGGGIGSNVFEDCVHKAEGGIDVDCIILVPLYGKEVDMGTVSVVKSGAEKWELGVQ